MKVRRLMLVVFVLPRYTWHSLIWLYLWIAYYSLGTGVGTGDKREWKNTVPTIKASVRRDFKAKKKKSIIYIARKMLWEHQELISNNLEKDQTKQTDEIPFIKEIIILYRKMVWKMLRK